MTKKRTIKKYDHKIYNKQYKDAISIEVLASNSSRIRADEILSGSLSIGIACFAVNGVVHSEIERARYGFKE